MNALIRIPNIIGLGSLLALTVSFSAFPVHAGPSPQFWNRPQYVTAGQQAATVQPGNPAAIVCSACKNITLRDSKHVGPAGKGHEEWFVIGSRHECTHCGGTIAVVQGKATDSMARYCPMCVKGTTFHCITQVGSKKT
jgi:hypothetical protein